MSANIGNTFTAEVVVIESESSATLGEDFVLGVIPPDQCSLPPISTPPFLQNVSSVSSSLFFEFPAGDIRERCTFITVLDDDIFEEEESFKLQINGTSPYSVPISSPDECITFTINRDPQGTSHVTG